MPDQYRPLSARLDTSRNKEFVRATLTARLSWEQIQFSCLLRPRDIMTNQRPQPNRPNQTRAGGISSVDGLLSALDNAMASRPAGAIDSPLFLVHGNRRNPLLDLDESISANVAFTGEAFLAGRAMAESFLEFGAEWAILSTCWGALLPGCPIKGREIPDPPASDWAKLLAETGLRFGGLEGWARVVVDTLAAEFAGPCGLEAPPFRDPQPDPPVKTYAPRPLILYAPELLPEARSALVAELESATWADRLHIFDGLDLEEAITVAKQSRELSRERLLAELQEFAGRVKAARAFEAALLAPTAEAAAALSELGIDDQVDDGLGDGELGIDYDIDYPKGGE